VLDGPFLGSAAVAAGLLTRAELRSPRYHMVYRDVYVDADRELDLVLRSQAAHLLLPAQGALCGHSAASLLGADCSPTNAPAEVIAPLGEIRKRRGLVVRQDVLTPIEVCDVVGHRVTTPFRTAWDLGRRLRLTEAVVALDALARVGRFAPAALLDGPPGARGCRQLRRAVEFANPLAESAMESRLRMLLVLAGLPTPVLQYRVVDRRGNVLARVDLAYPEARLALEYDGGDHFDEEHGRRDRRRDLQLDELDWYTMRFTRDDVLLTPQDTVRRVLRRRAARLALFAA
jgi:very-short-patch-repair endonuclease